MSSCTFTIEHRDRRLHTNADGLSKQTQHYERAEKVREEMMPGFSFITQEQFDVLPILNKEEAEGNKKEEPLEQEDELRSVYLERTEYYSESRTSAGEEDGPRNVNADKLEVKEVIVEKPSETENETMTTTQMEDETKGEWLKREARANYTPEDFHDYPDINDDSCGTDGEEGSQTKTEDEMTIKVRTIKGPDGGIYIDRNGATRKQCKEVAQACAILVQPKYGTLQLKKAQRQDVALSTMIRYLFLESTQGVTPRRSQPALKSLTQAQKGWFTRNKQELELSEKKVLLKRIEGPDGITMRRTIVIPQLSQLELRHEAHEMNAHQGEQQTSTKSTDILDLPAMRADMRE